MFVLSRGHSTGPAYGEAAAQLLEFGPELLGVLGRSGKQLKQFGWIHQMACPAKDVLYVAELLSWRVQKLVLHG